MKPDSSGPMAVAAASALSQLQGPLLGLHMSFDRTPRHVCAAVTGAWGAS